MESSTWAFVALLSQPVLLAIGDVLLKQMKKLPEEPVSFAQGIALACFASLYMGISGEAFSFVLELNGQAWFWLLLSCSLTIASQIYKKKAVDSYEVCQL